MKAVIITGNLQRGITIASHAVSQRSQLPILLNFLISAENGFLTISATDLEIGIITKIPAKTDEEGQVSVPAKTFLDLVSSISKEKITLETKENTLVLNTEGTRSTFPTSDPQEFPQVLGEEGIRILEMKKEEVEKEMGKIVFSASSDMGRPALSGVLIKGEEDGFVLVATDGYRLSLKKGLISKDSKKTISIIVPARIIRELISLPDGEIIDLFVSDKNNQVIFVVGNTTLVGRLIESEYPDYEKIIPRDFGTKAIIDRIEMQSAVKQGSVFAREASNIIKLSIQKDKIVISANAPSVGENVVDVSAKVEGEENEIAFNARYLLDLFSSVDDESLIFEMSGPLSPGVFRSEKDKDFLHLIMPIRVQG
jgi:DNA polymerase-3 subunit beta